MPEGPSIVILTQQAGPFTGRHILRASGNTRMDKQVLRGQRILALRSFGKQFLLQLPSLTVRIHFLLFGSWLVDERKDRTPRLSLAFARGELNLYACSVRYLEGDLDDLYDWRTDVLSPAWDPALARERLRAQPETLACDARLDQGVFAGVGNIIKNEVLFRIHVHPLSRIGALPARKLDELVHEARRYSFQFLAWKRAFVLRKHWLAHNQGTCPRDHVPFQRAWLGRTHRRSFWCERCQVRYGAA
jgi:endonuclease-8